MARVLPSDEEIRKRIRKIGIPTKDALAGLKKLGVTLSGKDEEVGKPEIKTEYIRKNARIATQKIEYGEPTIEVAQVGVIEIVSLKMGEHTFVERGKIGDKVADWELTDQGKNILDSLADTMRQELINGEPTSGSAGD